MPYVMPAEWEPHCALWLSWPLNPETWPGRQAAVQTAYARFASLVSRYEPVCINCIQQEQARVRQLLQSADAEQKQVKFFDHPTNDAWIRDYGPVFVKDRSTGAVALTDWSYNAWGGKFEPWDLDNAIPARIAEATGLPRRPVPLVGEGGGLEVNGQGILLTTETVLLNPNRNPAHTHATIEPVLKAALGVEDIVWLPGGLAGDDTDGHIDTLTRFFAPDAVLTQMDPKGPNETRLAENRERLARFTIVDLPSPAPIRPDGWRQSILPASYANFLILNDAVLVPTYRQPQADDQALGILGDCFPGRAIHGVDCYDILLEGGALHCLSQQQPA